MPVRIPRKRPRFMRLGEAGRAVTGLVLAMLVAGWCASPAASQTLTLPQAVERALVESPELRDTRLGAEAAREQASEARGRLLPRLDLAFRYTRNLTAPATFLPAILFDPTAGPDDLIRVSFGGDNVWTTGLVAEQPLFDARAFAGLQASGRFVDLSDEEVRSRVHQTVTEVRVRYYDLLLAREQERLLENSLRRVETSLVQARALEAEGLASEYDVLRLEVELANLESGVRRARNAGRAGARDLAVALGLDPDPDAVEVVGSLAEMDLDDPDANAPANREILAFMGLDPEGLGEEGVRGRARAERGELRVLEREIGLREAELRAERAAYLPRLSLFGNYDVQAQQDGSPAFFGESGERGYGRMIGVQLSIPIFAGFQRAARAERARTELRRSETRRQFAVDRTDAQVGSLLEAAEEARMRAAAQRRAVDQATRGFEIVSAQLAEGLVSQFELIDAEVSLRESEFNYAEAVHEYLTVRARIDQVAGAVPGTGG